MTREEESMKNLSFENIEDTVNKLHFPQTKYIGNGLYKLSEGVICNEELLKEIHNKIRKEVTKL